MATEAELRSQRDEEDKRTQRYWTLFEAESVRLSGWLVLGNTGALVLYYQALVGRQICDLGLLGEMGASFFWGLILVVSATVLGLATRWFSWHFHWLLFSAISDEHDAVLTQNAQAKSQAHHRRDKIDNHAFWSLWRPGMVSLITLLQVLSAIALGLGTTAPLRDAHIQFCAAAASTESEPAAAALPQTALAPATTASTESSTP